MKMEMVNRLEEIPSQSWITHKFLLTCSNCSNSLTPQNETLVEIHFGSPDWSFFFLEWEVIIPITLWLFNIAMENGL